MCSRPSFRGQQIKCHKDQPLQHPHHKLEDHHRHRSPSQQSKQRPPGIHQNAMAHHQQIHQKHLWMAKAPGAAKAKKKASEPHPGTMASTGPATQPSDSSKNTIICSGCGKKWPLEQEIVHIISVIFVEWPPTPHTCVEPTKCGPGSPVCI